MAAAFIQGCEGFGTGYQYAVTNKKNEEVKQGKNFYIAALYFTGEIAILCSVVGKVAEAYFQGIKWYSTVILNALPIIFLPAGILLASIKHRNYTQIVSYFSKTLGRVLPSRLGLTTKRALTFVHDYASPCVKVAMLVGVVSLACLGFHIYSAVFAASILFHEIDIRGYLPRKVSLFCERYFPTVVSGCLVVTSSSLLLRVICGLSLASNFSFFNRFTLHRIDSLFRYFVPLAGPSLAEYEAPVRKVGDLTFKEINDILNASMSDFQVNPSHCSKPVSSPLPKNYDFEGFLRVFERVQWKETLVFKKLKDDDRFLAFLKEKNPEIEIAQQLENIAKDPTFFVNWMKQEFATFVKVLKGEIRPQGDQIDLAVAIENSAKILSYLQKPSLSQMEKEDILLKLAVEAGGYCARGLKRATGEIVDEVIVSSPVDIKDVTPQKLYEWRLLQALQNRRRDILHNKYQQLTELLPKSITQDVHGFDIYRLSLSLGFYPLSEHEREQVGIAEVLTWENYSSFHKNMMLEYQNSLDDVVSESEVNFAEYLRRYIETNTKLTKVQKEKLIDKWINNEVWEPDEVIRRFHRLGLVKLGVLQKVA